MKLNLIAVMVKKELQISHTRINFHTNQSIEISFEKLFIFIRKGRRVESRIHNKTRDFRMNYGKQLTADSELH